MEKMNIVQFNFEQIKQVIEENARLKDHLQTAQDECAILNEIISDLIKKNNDLTHVINELKKALRQYEKNIVS